MQRLLIIEDDPSLRRALVAALSTHAAVVRACSTVAEARATLPDFRPELMVLDVSLPDGDAFDVLASAHALPAMPIVIGISGEARADQAFRLAQRGATLERALSSVLAEPPDLVPHLRAAVGCAPVREVEAVVRRTMVSEALGRTRGSKNGAAKILRVSRQLLQHMVRGALQ